MERAAFLTVLHRLLVCGGSDRAADRLARGLSHRRRRRDRTATSLSHDGVAGRGACRKRPTGQRRDAVFAALREGRPGGGVVRLPARLIPSDHARHRVHGHHQPPFRRRGRPDAGAARLLQGSSARPQPDDPGRASRRRRPAGVHRDVAGKLRRREQPDPGDRSPAASLAASTASASWPTAA